MLFREGLVPLPCDLPGSVPYARRLGGRRPRLKGVLSYGLCFAFFVSVLFGSLQWGVDILWILLRETCKRPVLCGVGCLKGCLAAGRLPFCLGRSAGPRLGRRCDRLQKSVVEAKQRGRGNVTSAGCADETHTRRVNSQCVAAI